MEEIKPAGGYEFGEVGYYPYVDKEEKPEPKLEVDKDIDKYAVIARFLKEMKIPMETELTFTLPSKSYNNLYEKLSNGAKDVYGEFNMNVEGYLFKFVRK